MNGWESWEGEAIEAAIAAAVAEGLHKTGERVAAAGSDNAPLLNGDLRRSADVIDDASEGAVYVVMGMGPSSDYAVDQHENMSFSHPRGGGPKFLENALNDEGARHIESDVAEAVRKVTGR